MFGLDNNIDDAAANAEDRDDRWSHPYLALAMLFSGAQNPDGLLELSDLFTPTAAATATATATASASDGQKHLVNAATTRVANAASISAGVMEDEHGMGQGQDDTLVSPYDADTLAFFGQIERIVFGASKDHDLIPSNGMS